MTRLIDADEAIKRLGDAHFKNYGNAIMVIRETPTVDAQPVRHGKWIEDGRALVCSCCGKAYTLAETNYCWQCGAKMEWTEKQNDSD